MLLHAFQNGLGTEAEQRWAPLLERSPQLTGVETLGCALARSEYTQTVDLCSAF